MPTTILHLILHTGCPPFGRPSPAPRIGFVVVLAQLLIFLAGAVSFVSSSSFVPGSGAVAIVALAAVAIVALAAAARLSVLGSGGGRTTGGRFASLRLLWSPDVRKEA